MRPLKVVIGADAASRETLRRVLAVNSSLVISGEASEPLSLVMTLKQQRPDVVLIDMALPQPLLVEAIRQAREASQTTEVICLIGVESERVLREAWGAGARGFILKAHSENHALAAIESVAMHKPYVEPELAAQVVPGLLVGLNQGGQSGTRTPHLTPREREIVQLVADGRTSKEIAASLSLSPKTVEAHRASILKKLNIRSASQMVLHAVRNNIIPA